MDTAGAVLDLDRARRERIGGSEAASACGVDPHRSRVMLWAEKTGRVQREETDAMRWGKLLEPVIIAALRDDGYTIHAAPQVTSPDPPWLAGTLDGLVQIARTREPAVLEVKTAGTWAAQDWREDAGAPLAYLVQVHHYMALTGRDAALLACLVAGQRLVTRIVERDARVIERMLELEEQFLGFVRRDEPPPPDGSESAKDALRALYPAGHGGTVRLLGDDYAAVKELRRREEQLAAVTVQRDALKQRVQLAMGEAEVAIDPWDNVCARWTTFARRAIDTKALRTQRPNIADEYTVETTQRRFTVE